MHVYSLIYVYWSIDTEVPAYQPVAALSVLAGMYIFEFIFSLLSGSILAHTVNTDLNEKISIESYIDKIYTHNLYL
jgi:hypothetical protein